MYKVLYHRPSLFAGTVLLALSPLLCSAQVYKCTENGNTTFQSEPCKGTGKQIHVDAGPSEQSIQEAQARAEKDKQAVLNSDADRQQAKSRLPAAAPVDCAKLNKAVDDAKAQYTQLLREGGLPGATAAGLRNNNRLATSAQQQLNTAQQNAAMYGCQH